MTVSTIVAGLALLVAAAALVSARRTARRFEGLSEAYWELRYEYGQVTSRLNRLEDANNPSNDAEPASPRPVPTAFVPLSSLKR